MRREASKGGVMTAENMLASIRGTLLARAEGHNEGGDIEVMRAVDQIEQRGFDAGQAGLIEALSLLREVSGHVAGELGDRIDAFLSESTCKRVK